MLYVGSSHCGISSMSLTLFSLVPCNIGLRIQEGYGRGLTVQFVVFKLEKNMHSSKGQENAGLKLGHVMGQGVEIIEAIK